MSVTVRSRTAWLGPGGRLVYVVRWFETREAVGEAVAEQSCERLGVWSAEELRRALAEQKRKQQAEQSGEQSGDPVTPQGARARPR